MACFGNYPYLNVNFRVRTVKLPRSSCSALRTFPWYGLARFLYELQQRASDKIGLPLACHFFAVHINFTVTTRERRQCVRIVVVKLHTVRTNSACVL